jgi:hypothetical protein
MGDLWMRCSSWVLIGVVGFWGLGASSALADDAPQCADGADLDLHTLVGATPPAVGVPEAAGQAIQDFQVTVQQNGLPAGLRTFALIVPFRLYLDGTPPMAVTPATLALGRGWTVGAWAESVRGRCADSTEVYSVGEFSDDRRRARHAYVQIWQYDPRIANWGLRELLIKAVPEDKS